MNPVCVSILLLVTLVGLGQCGTGEMGSSCKVSSSCKNDLACDIRIDPITYTCLGILGTTCSKDNDCANNLDCVSGKCACDPKDYYNRDVKDCFSKLTFGSKCKSDLECATGVCSTVGSLKGTCKLDIGETCSSGKDCANQQSCIDGKCGCDGARSSYNKQTHDCELKRLSGENQPCKANSDCQAGLACDTSVNGNKTNTCKRGLGQYCLYFEDCANNIGCENEICACSAGYFYDSSAKDCFNRRQYSEACTKNGDCGDNLACDVRVQPTPLSYRRNFQCKKTYGVQCINSTECVNYLPCNDGFCGCRPNYYYNNLLVDCFPKQEFGRPCQTNNECLPTLACDNSQVGDQLMICSGLPGNTCASFSDCVNNVDCFDGKCGCAKNQIFDNVTKICVNIRSMELQEPSSEQ